MIDHNELPICSSCFIHYSMIAAILYTSTSFTFYLITVSLLIVTLTWPTFNPLLFPCQYTEDRNAFKAQSDYSPSINLSINAPIMFVTKLLMSDSQCRKLWKLFPKPLKEDDYPVLLEIVSWWKTVTGGGWLQPRDPGGSWSVIQAGDRRRTHATVWKLCQYTGSGQHVGQFSRHHWRPVMWVQLMIW